MKLYSITQNGYELATAKSSIMAFKKAKQLSYLFVNLKVELKRER